MLILLLLAMVPEEVLAIRVFESLVKLGQDDSGGDSISGAKLIDDRRINITDITLCIRFLTVYLRIRIRTCNYLQYIFQLCLGIVYTT